MIFLQYFNVCVTSLSRYWLKSWQNYTFFANSPRIIDCHFFSTVLRILSNCIGQTSFKRKKTKTILRDPDHGSSPPTQFFLLKSTRTALDMFQQAPNRPISIEQIEMVLNKIVYRWSDICTIETFFFTCLINIKKFFFCSLFQSKIWWAYLCLGNVGCVARNWYRRMLSQICFRLKKKISSK